MAAIDELDADECLTLLAQHDFGRVGFVSDGKPVILPVNYVLDGETLVLRTDPGQKLADIPMRMVAFEVDEVTDTAAWSVLVQGFAREVTNAVGRRYEAMRRLPIAVRVPGDKANWIAIDVTRISGRRLR
jgi:nitroimidazol reductase NimA-like FMN-containing flavoprotein (pyridoxamine 5'-phosphate oxidase superfamily)